MSKPHYEYSLPHGIMFHHFMNDVHPWSQGAITADKLVDIIEYVGPKNIISCEEWQERSVKGTLENHHLCFTFDDSLLCQYDIAWPVMKKYGITGFFFIYSCVFDGKPANLEMYRYFRSVAFDSIDTFYDVFFKQMDSYLPGLYDEKMRGMDIDQYLIDYPFFSTMDRAFRYVRDHVLTTDQYEKIMDDLISQYGFNKQDIIDKLWMTNGQLKELHDAGNAIGLHSYSHPIPLKRLPADKQTEEYQKNYDHIMKATGAAPTSMSHPANSYGDDTIPILRNLNIQLGFRADMAKVADPNEFEYPRQDHTNLVNMMQ